jgi:hypothetical protein
MTVTEKRKRGRPSKADLAARHAAEEAEAMSLPDADWLSRKLAEPIKAGRSILQPDNDTLRVIAELARLFCTQAEIAAVLGVSRRTLQTFLYAHEVGHQAWEAGLQHAKISLRRKQLALADKSAPVAIFLGKNYLGQRDEQHTTTTVNRTAQEMTEDELLEIARRGVVKPEKAVH